MDDKPVSVKSEMSILDKELLAQQAVMDAEFQSRQLVTPLPFDINASKFTLPKYENYLSRTVSIPNGSHSYIKLIFSALNMASYIIFTLDRGKKTDKKQALTIFPMFIEYICSAEVDKRDQLKILKSFETYRVNHEKVLPQSSGIGAIRLALRMALDDEDFRENVSAEDHRYLNHLSKTKSAPSVESTAPTFTSWIAGHSWLRRDDVGIGHDMYSRLASPKATINSFLATVEIALSEIQQAKDALIEFFRVSKINAEDIPVPQRRAEHSNSKCSHDVHVRNCFLATFDTLQKAYNLKTDNNPALDKAILFFIAENIHPSSWGKYNDAFFSGRPGYNSPNIVIGFGRLLFSMTFIHELAAYASKPAEEVRITPTCHAEHLLFQWILATQTVQASDIPKLSRNDFRFVTRRDGRITHLQLTYYKGRAKTTHSTRDIGANTLKGRVLVKFINERTQNDDWSGPLTHDIGHIGILGSFQRFILLLGTYLKKEINQGLLSANTSPVFLSSMTALVTNGNTKGGKYDTKMKTGREVETPVRAKLFGLSIVKTTAVHASSDTFSPTQLINYHSHTDKTERKCYLTKENQEWVNNCGRITRAVMSDLAVNLFRASNEQKQIFNSEFTRASNYISSKGKETEARMKLVTETFEGRIDNLGIIAAKPNPTDSADTLYLTDTPETVMKLRHYLSEVRKNHALLAKCSPEYLLFTVLPTTEWIESMFQHKRFRCVDEGDLLFRKYGTILPPLFSAHI